ncbi:MAG TPA: PEGA domain-containing protein, partial [Polyangia bacterium]|jgi:hypothetical protein
MAVAGVIAARRPAPAASAVVTTTRAVLATPAASAMVSPLASATPATAMPAASAPATVQIHLTTRPAGAEVIVEGEASARGTTPLVITLPRGSDVRRLILAAPGYTRAFAEITPDVDSRVHYDLDRAPRRRVARKPKPAPPELPLPLIGHPGIRDDIE